MELRFPANRDIVNRGKIHSIVYWVGATPENVTQAKGMSMPEMALASLWRFVAT